MRSRCVNEELTSLFAKDASARCLRDEMARLTGIRDLAGVIADSDGRPDRRGATVLALGAAGIHPLRITEHRGKRQEETLVYLVAATPGLVLGQRGRGAPVALVTGVEFDRSDAGVAAMLRHAGGHGCLGKPHGNPCPADPP